MTKHIVRPQQLQAFETVGFVTLEGLAGSDEVDEIYSVCRTLLDSQAGKSSGDQFDLAGNNTTKATLPQIMHPSKYAPALERLAYRERAKDVARQLLGEEVALTNEHFIIKPAHHGSPTPWHQDQAYHNPALRYNNVNVWLALDDATMDNGCLQYVPGSHRFDVLPHHHIGHDPNAAGLEVDQAEEFAARAVAAPVPAGGVAIHRSYMLHYAGPNQTNRPRAAYVLVFGTAPVSRETPLVFPWLSTRHQGSKVAEARQR